MINRVLTAAIKKSTLAFPIIGIIGPRQSGKTTLTKKLFPKYQYVNFEQLDNRRFAIEDPRGFLAKYPQKVIFDEVQRVPELFSYLQVHVDEHPANGQFILTGSQHFLMLSSITQTLAGRIGLFHLYPLSNEELALTGLISKTASTQIFMGGYPRLYDQHLSPSVWLPSYIQTYLDRDVSLLSQIDNLSAFEKFLHLIAGRTGQLLNMSALGGEAGVTHNTIKAWISLLETSGIVFLLKPYYANISKRLNKTPKLYFVDTGVACQLLGITQKDQLINHPLYGALFETMIVTEFKKYFANRGSPLELYFWRDQQGVEADIVLPHANQILLYEIKASQTIPADPFGRLPLIQKVLPAPSQLHLIYGGQENQARTNGQIIDWASVSSSLKQTKI